jgi:uncharacterized membrane protein
VSRAKRTKRRSLLGWEARNHGTPVAEDDCMKHSQAFVLLMIAVSVMFALALWAGSLWGALGVLVSGFVVAFVFAMAWLWSPGSGVITWPRRRRRTQDSMPETK